MTLTLSALGWTFHVELCTDPPEDGGYDHDVVSVSLDAVPDEGEALGFISPAVERE